MQYIRIKRTEEINRILSYFKERYILLSEVEIIKMVISDFLYQVRQKEAVSRSLQEQLTTAEKK
jgi:hypothetical protein